MPEQYHTLYADPPWNETGGGKIKRGADRHYGLYDEGYTRLGCLMCPMANVKNQQRDTLRYPKYKELYIEAFDKMVEKQKKGKGCRWNNGQEVWDWWVALPRKKDCDGQTFIFE